MPKVPGVKMPKMPGVKMPGPKPMKPVSARGQVSGATAGVEEDRIMTRVKRPVRTKVPRVI